MKRKSLLAAASAVVFLAGSANAELIFGLSTFPLLATGPVAGTADFGNFTVSLDVGETDSVFASDNTYGDTIYTIPTGNASQWTSAGGVALEITLTATADSPNAVNALVFDAIVTGSGSTATYTVTSPSVGTVTGSFVNSGSFVSIFVNLGAILLNDTIVITLSGPAIRTVAIDNIGIVPEPSGALALAGLLGAGLLVRSRRGEVKTPVNA